MMNPLKISDRILFLEGISLRSQFILENPNTHLAINFTISEDNLLNKNKLNIFDIFPNNGIILPKQQRSIMVKASKSFDWSDICSRESDNVRQLKVSQNFNNQYNQIRYLTGSGVEKQNLNTISYEQLVYVQIGVDHIAVLEDLSSQAAFIEELGTKNIEISMITNSGDEKNFAGKNSQIFSIVQELSLNSKIKESVPPKQPDSSFTSVHKNISMHSVNDSKFVEEESPEILNTQFNVRPIKRKDINFIEILILTIISAFFFSLGSNIKNILNI